MKQIAFLLILLIPVSSVFAQDSKNVAASKELIAAFKAKDFKKATVNFDQQMLKALPAAQLEQVWKTLEEQFGVYDSFSTVTETKEQGYEMVYLLCQFKQAKLKMRTVFDSGGKIAGLFFLPSE